jgi:nucleotide-binding universal stress UspA family protein
LPDGVAIVRDLVVGIDGSTTSWRAFSMAVGIATRYEARVHACFVLHVPPSADLAVFAVPVTAFVDGDDGGDLGRDVAEELSRAGVKGDFTYVKGDVAHELEELAQSCRADVIVVGRSHHPALHLGGVPRKLLATGRRPVLVVP